MSHGNKKHGMSATLYYAVWRQMIQRCTNKNTNGYPSYGGAGVTVSGDWLVFENFLRDMGPRPAGMTLDRIENSKGYSKENCRWATRKEQAHNRENTKYYSYLGEKKTLWEWSLDLGISKTTLYRKVVDKGIPFETVISDYLKEK